MGKPKGAAVTIQATSKPIQGFVSIPTGLRPHGKLSTASWGALLKENEGKDRIAGDDDDDDGDAEAVDDKEENDHHEGKGTGRN